MRLQRRKRKRRLLLKIFIILLIFSIFGVLGLYAYVRNNILTESPRNDTDIIENYEPDLAIPIAFEGTPTDSEGTQQDRTQKDEYEEQKGITNILLIGTDARDLNEKARADSIIIATIDGSRSKLKFTSILRDTYVSIPRHSQQKINSAYAIGGPRLLMDTIERNFKIKLDKYIIINFLGFEDSIDALGGVDINIKDYEINEMNKYIGEVRENKSPPITQSGIQHLDGQQTLAYSRIRMVGNGSYERTQRQRTVLSALAGKVKTVSVFQYSNLLAKLLPCIKTNVEPITILNYAYTVSKFKPLTISQLQMPMTELCDGRIYKGTWVFLMDKTQNSKVLNDFIFKDKETTVRELDRSRFKQEINRYLREE